MIAIIGKSLTLLFFIYACPISASGSLDLHVPRATALGRRIGALEDAQTWSGEEPARQTVGHRAAPRAVPDRGNIFGHYDLWSLIVDLFTGWHRRG